MERLRMLLVIKKVLSPLCIVLTFHIASTYAENAIENMLNEMSVRKKAGQMILVYNSPCDFLEKHNIGGVLIMQNMLKKPQKLKQKISESQKKLKIPLLVAIDQEGGTVNRLNYLPQWKKVPSAEVMTHWTEDSIFSYQKNVAETLTSIGININLAPVLDPAENHSGMQTYIAKKNRSYGTQPEKIVPPAKAFINSFSKNHIGCIAKHFPGYDVPVNSDYKIAVSNADSMQIAQYTLPFQTLQNDYSGIMMSSIHYDAICEVPAVFCPKIVNLARKIAPNGIIMTDDLWGVALRSFTLPGQKIHTLEYPDSAFTRIVAYVITAGNDMLMITYPAKVPLILDTIEKLAENDPAVMEHVNAAVRRILALKYKLNLFT